MPGAVSVRESLKFRELYDGGLSIPQVARYMKYTSASVGFITVLRDHLVTQLGIRAKIQVPRGIDVRGVVDNSMNIAYGSSSASTLASWLYDCSDEHVRCDRKYTIYREWKEG